MLKLVGSIAGLLKAKQHDHTTVDDTVFRLHYRWTTSLCFLCCVLVGAAELVGAPIQCLGDGSSMAERAVTTYCWIAATFTLYLRVPHGQTGHPARYLPRLLGLGTHDASVHEVRPHNYYQWVPFILFLLGCLFYVPHLVWKELEGKKCATILQGLNEEAVAARDERKLRKLVEYLQRSRGQQRRYAYGYLLLHGANMAAVVWALNALAGLFGADFWDYGTQALRYINDYNSNMTAFHNPMAIVFPTITKCTFWKYGPSGTIVNEDYMCLLPQNIMNEKIFLVLWFWLIFLLVANAVNILLLALQADVRVQVKVLERYGRVVPPEDLKSFLQTTPIGDYFLLATLAKNLDPFCLKKVLEGLMQGGGHPGGGCYPTLTLEVPVSLHSPNAPQYYTNEGMDTSPPMSYKKKVDEFDDIDTKKVDGFDDMDLKKVDRFDMTDVCE